MRKGDRRVHLPNSAWSKTPAAECCNRGIVEKFATRALLHSRGRNPTGFRVDIHEDDAGPGRTATCSVFGIIGRGA